MRRWAEVVASLLRPGGRLFIREGHPVLWALADPRRRGRSAIDYPYFEQSEPLVWDEGGTYVETDQEFTHNVTHEWNHGLGEIVTAVLEAGLELTAFEEHDSRAVERVPRADDGHRRRRVPAHRPPRATAAHLHAAGAPHPLTAGL